MRCFAHISSRGIVIGIFLLCLVFMNQALAATVQVSWNANTENDLAGYNVFYGISPGSYSVKVDVGKITQYTVDGLNINNTYYFAVTAYDNNGNESGYSQEVSYRIEDTTPPTATAVAEQADKVKVIFNEPVEKASAEIVSNYAINKGIIVQRAELQADLKTVYLFTMQHANAWYVLTINNVRDRASVPNAIQANTQVSYSWEASDQTPPALVSAELIRDNFLKVTFSEAVNQTSALPISNYSISPSVTITSTGIDGTFTVVYLTTGSHTPGQQYTLTAANIKDGFGNTIAANATKSYSLVPTDVTPPVPIAARTADATHVVVEFSESVDPISAQKTSSYSISSSITVQSAILNTDKRQVTLTTTSHSTGNFTITINAVADAATPPNVMTSSSQLTYAYTAPDNVPPRLESVVLTSVNYLQVAFNEPVERSSAENRTNYTITPSVTVVSAMLDVSQKTVLLQTSNHTDGTYSLRVSNVKDCATTPNTIDPNYATKSYSYITPDLTPPQLSKAILRGANLVELVFNESLDRTSSENIANYTLDKGVVVQKASLNGDSLNRVNLNTTSHTPGNTYTVAVTGIKDRASLPNTMNTQQRAVYDYPSQDNTPPKLISVTPASAQMIELVFDEALEQTSAENSASYSIATPSTVQIKTATLSANKTKVILNTYPHQPGKNYTIVVSGIKDMANPPNTIAFPNNQQPYFIVAQDLSAPELHIADLLNDRTLRLTFNEPLDPNTANLPANYTIDNGISVQGVSLSSQTYTEVILTTTPHPRGTYTVTIRNLKDQASTQNMLIEAKKSYAYQPVDKTPPVLKEQPKLVNSQTIELVFDEPLNPGSVVPANFIISNGISVERAVLDINGTRVLLTTSAHIPGVYTVNIRGIQDAYGGNTLDASTGTYAYAIQDKTPPQLMSAELSTKNMLVVKFSELLDNATAQQVSNYRIDNNIKITLAFIAVSGNEVVLQTTDHVTGEYTLTVNGVCDNSTSKNPIKAYSQIKYVWNPPDTSSPKLLSAVLDYNNFVNLNFDEALEEKSATVASNYKIEPPVQIFQAFLDASLSKVNLYTATHLSGTYKVTVSNVKDRAFTANTINSKFNTVQYSYTAPDTSAPKLEALELTTPMNLALRFNETVARETAENLANYVIDNGIKITNAYLTSDLNKVILETSSHQPRTNYSIRISGMKDRAPVPNALKSPIVKTYVYAAPDDTPPELLYAKLMNNTNNMLQMVFSEALDQQSVENTRNYSIDPSVEVLTASLDPSTLKTVLLETTSHMPGIEYGIYIRNVKDRAPVPNVIKENTYMHYSLPISGGVSLDDNTPPMVAKVNVLSQTQMEIVFTEPVDKATAENKNNYSILDSVSVQSAKLDTSLIKVYLTTTPHRSGKVYRIQISSIRDRATRPNILASGGAIKYLYAKGISVSNPNKMGYDLQMFSSGTRSYSDRNYTVQQAPDVLKQAIQVITKNDDKNSSEDLFLTFEMRGVATVMVAYDKRISPVPVWLSDWKATGDQIVDSRSSVYALYSKKSMGGRIILGGNKGTLDDNMYMVFVIPQAGNGALLAGLSKTAYSVSQVGSGDTYYIDRTYTVSSIPDSVSGLLWIKTANDDKTNREAEFLRFTLNEDSKIYIAYDSRIASRPKWLENWGREEGQIIDSRGSKFDILSKSYNAGDVVLGGNCGAPEDNMYVVMLAPLSTESDRGISELPGYFTLTQNYPNPFNPKTTFHYKVHKDGRFKITIFNLLGQTIKVLVDKDFKAGYQGEAVWDATDHTGRPVATGIYFYRIEQDQFAKTRRMTLLR